MYAVFCSPNNKNPKSVEAVRINTAAPLFDHLVSLIIAGDSSNALVTIKFGITSGPKDRFAAWRNLCANQCHFLLSYRKVTIKDLPRKTLDKEINISSGEK